MTRRNDCDLEFITCVDGDKISKRCVNNKISKKHRMRTHNLQSFLSNNDFSGYETVGGGTSFTNIDAIGQSYKYSLISFDIENFSNIDNRNLKGALEFRSKHKLQYELITNQYTDITETFVFIPLWKETVKNEKLNENVYLGNTPKIERTLDKIFPAEFATFLSRVSTLAGRQALGRESCEQSIAYRFPCLDATVPVDCSTAVFWPDYPIGTVEVQFASYMFGLYTLREHPYPEPDGYGTVFPRCPFWNNYHWDGADYVAKKVLDVQPTTEDINVTYEYESTTYEYGYGKYVDTNNPDFEFNDDFIASMRPMRIIREDIGPTAITVQDSVDYTIVQYLRVAFDLDINCASFFGHYPNMHFSIDERYLYDILANGASSGAYPEFDTKFNDKINSYISTINDKTFNYLSGNKTVLDFPRDYHGGAVQDIACFSTVYPYNQFVCPGAGFLGGESKWKKTSASSALSVAASVGIQRLIHNYKISTEYVTFDEWDSLDDNSHFYYPNVYMKYGVNKNTINGRSITIGRPEIISILKTNDTVSSIIDSNWNDFVNETVINPGLCIESYESSISIPILHIKRDGLTVRVIDIYKENLLVGPQYTEFFKPHIFVDEGKDYDIKEDSQFHTNLGSSTQVRQLNDFVYDKDTTKLLNVAGMRLSPQKINGWGDGDFLLYCVEHEPVKTEVYTDIYNQEGENDPITGINQSPLVISDDKKCRTYYKELSLFDFHRNIGDIILVDSPRLTRMKQLLTRTMNETIPWEFYKDRFGPCQTAGLVGFSETEGKDGDYSHVTSSNNPLRNFLQANRDFENRHLYCFYPDSFIYKNIFEQSPLNQFYYLGFPIIPSLYNIYTSALYYFRQDNLDDINTVLDNRHIINVFNDRWNYLISDYPVTNSSSSINNRRWYELASYYFSFRYTPYPSFKNYCANATCRESTAINAPIIPCCQSFPLDKMDNYITRNLSDTYKLFNTGGTGDFINIEDVMQDDEHWMKGSTKVNSISDGFSNYPNKGLEDKKLVTLRKYETEDNSNTNIDYVLSNMNRISTFDSIQQFTPNTNPNTTAVFIQSALDYSSPIYNNFNYGGYFSGCILDKDIDTENFASFNYINDVCNDNRFLNFFTYTFNGDSIGTNDPHSNSQEQFSFTENHLEFDAIKNEPECPIVEYNKNIEQDKRNVYNYNTANISNDKNRSVKINGNYYDKIFRAIVVFDGPESDLYDSLFDNNGVLTANRMADKFSVLPSKKAEKVMWDLGPIIYNDATEKWTGQFLASPYSYFISSNIFNPYQDYYYSYQARSLQAGKFDASNKTFRGLDQISLLLSNSIQLRKVEECTYTYTGNVDEFEFDNYFFPHNLELSIDSDGLPSLVSNSMYTRNSTSESILMSECHASRFGFNFEIDWPFIEYDGTNFNSTKKLVYRSYNSVVQGYGYAPATFFSPSNSCAIVPAINPLDFTNIECVSLKVQNYKARLLLIPEALFNGKYDCVMTRTQSIMGRQSVVATVIPQENDPNGNPPEPETLESIGENYFSEGLPLASDVIFGVPQESFGYYTERDSLQRPEDVLNLIEIDYNGKDIDTLRSELVNSIRFTECKNANVS